MKKIRYFLLLIIIVISTSNICISQDDDSWTSMNPLSIPLEIRQTYYDKGNLIPNPSFELVESHQNDSNIENYKMSEWNVVGNNVELTDITKHTYESNEAYHGNHAMKIDRNKNDVKEINNQSEGVISDFIEVIPANYDFYFDIRLEEIIPSDYPIDRFQKRIGKDIDIHIKFFDKDKNEIYSGIYFGYVNKDIDSSFKGFAFSNYYYIDKFDWGRVRGATWYYPFSDGDLPDECRYIKIFLGLKGSGTMWIDNVDFRLSKWNFTPLERMNDMFEKDYDLTELMVPTPKVVENKLHIELQNNKIVLVDAATESAEIKSAMDLLEKEFSKIHDGSVTIHRSDTILQESTDLIQIVLTDDMQLLPSGSQDALETIEDKEQGYLIRRQGNKIFLGANHGEGLYYAVTTLSQLIDFQNVVIEYADITDYPDFEGRSTRLLNYNNEWTLQQNSSLSDSERRSELEIRDDNLERQLDDLDFYTFYKINEFYNSYFSLSNRWWNPGEFYQTLYDEVGKKSSKYGSVVNLTVQINPYFHIDMEVPEESLSDSLRDIFSHATDEGFEKVKNVLTPALEAGAGTVMFASDDYVPHSGIIRGEYTLFTDPDKATFTNLANAQYYFLNKLKSWLDNEYGNIRLEFVPPAYNNWFIDYGRGISEIYFRDLNRHLDPSVVLIWTGNVIRSLTYDLADINKIIEIYKRKPMVWDNSPYARSVETVNGGFPINYPKKAVMNNIFQPFDIQYPKDFPSYIDSRYYSNLRGFGEINKIQYMTFADFSWNTADYDPDFSLFKALVQYVGMEHGKQLLKFNEAFYQFVSTWGQVRMNKEDNPEYKCSENQKNQAEREIQTMTKAFVALEFTGNETLKKELEDKMNTKVNEWRKLCETL